MFGKHVLLVERGRLYRWYRGVYEIKNEWPHAQLRVEMKVRIKQRGKQKEANAQVIIKQA